MNKKQIISIWVGATLFVLILLFVLGNMLFATESIPLGVLFFIFLILAIPVISLTFLLVYLFKSKK